MYIHIRTYIRMYLRMDTEQFSCFGDTFHVCWYDLYLHHVQVSLPLCVEHDHSQTAQSYTTSFKD